MRLVCVRSVFRLTLSSRAMSGPSRSPASSRSTSSSRSLSGSTRGCPDAATSGRQRPGGYGGPFTPDTFPGEVNAMAPADAARISLRGIRDDAPYIFTRLSDRADVRRRFSAIVADFDRWERVLPELGL